MKLRGGREGLWVRRVTCIHGDMRGESVLCIGGSMAVRGRGRGGQLSLRREI